MDSRLIYHIWTCYESKDLEVQRRSRLAQKTWQKQPWIDVPVHDADLPRMFREKGRAWPFIKDVLDWGMRRAEPNDSIVAYTNADIHVRGDICERIQEVMQQTDACYAFRRDFAKITGAIPDAEFCKGNDYCGSDLFCFRASWWKNNRTRMADMIIGGEGYDPMLRLLAERTNPGKVVALKDVIAHERHSGPGHWEHPQNRYTWQMQKHCLRTAYHWFKQMGVNPAIHGIKPI